MEWNALGLACAHPHCNFYVHSDVEFGGYCCKKCHWVYSTGSKSKKHGDNCLQLVADELAPKAPHCPPQKPGNFGPARSDAESRSAQPVSYPEPQPPVVADSSCCEAWRAWEGTASKEHQQVIIKGFVSHAPFNGLPATVECSTPDGRYHLRLADDTLLKYVKERNFDWPARVQTAGEVA